MSIYYPVNLHIFFSRFINDHIVFPNHILVICSETNSFGEICAHPGKHLNIFKFTIYFLYRFCRIFYTILSNIITYFFKSDATNGLIRNFSIGYSPINAFNSSKLSQPSPSLTASSASCSFINSFFSARSRS